MLPSPQQLPLIFQNQIESSLSLWLPVWKWNIMRQFSPTLKALKGPEDQGGALWSSVPSAYLPRAH